MNPRFAVLSFLLAASAAANLQGGDAVSQPAAREKLLADLGKIGVAGSAKSPAEPAKDPFNPPPADLRDVAAQGETARRSEAELPSLLIERIRPTGSMVLGDEPFLLFTERRQKIGDKLPVELDGVEYIVEIISIGANRFRIRYNGKEAERTIK